MQPQNKIILKFSLLVFFLAGSFTLLFFTGVYAYLKPAVLQQWVASFGWWAPLVYIGLYALLPLLLFPGAALSLAGGLLFGPIRGTLYTLVGATLAATFAYLIAHKLGRDFVAARLRGRGVNFDLFTEKAGFKIIFFLRLIPLFPFDVINYAAGLSRIKLSHFLAATVLGMAPGTFAYNFLGSTLIDIGSPKFIVALGFLGLLLIISLLYRRRIKKDAAAGKES